MAFSRSISGVVFQEKTTQETPKIGQLLSKTAELSREFFNL